jgi:hypothetical protein
MTFSSNQSLNTNQLPISLDVNPEEPNYQSILQAYLRRVANAVNTKQSGLFLLQETSTFSQYYTIANPQQNRSSYRLTVDLVLLNGGNIGTGTTSLVLTGPPAMPPFTQPQAISGYLYPTSSNGGALDSTGKSWFINDPLLSVQYISSTNTIIIVNGTGSALTWCMWTMEYLKN